MSDLCVVHLVRKKNGMKPFKRFVESYLSHAAGRDHDLLLVFKGFSADENIEMYTGLLANVRYNKMYVPDVGFDIRAYMKSAAVTDYAYGYYCFLNSFSNILCDNWLLKLYSIVSQENVGLAGATGSYESPYTHILNKPGIRKVVPVGNFWIKVPALIVKLHDLTVKKLEQFKYKAYFDEFPNYHIRTNAFIISGSLLKKIKCRPILNKMAAHLFESGKNSLSKQILNMGKEIIVVGRDGIGYRKEEWPSSRTFRNGNQENLLVGDNQTERYELSSDSDKLKFVKETWQP